jgi:hypothetical protein
MRIVSLAASALISALAGLPSAPIAGAQSGCDQLGGNVQSGNVCHVSAETPTYMIDMRFRTDYPDDQPVTNYLTQFRDRLVNAAQAPGAQNVPYLMTVRSDIYRSGQPTRTIPEYGQPWHGTVSLVLKMFSAVEGANPGTTYKSFTYDYDHNRPVTFENLFAPGSNPMDSVYPAVATELKRQFVGRTFQLSSAVGRDPRHYQNFAITDEEVIFFFDTSELMPEEAGYFYAPVSRANLPALQL